MAIRAAWRFADIMARAYPKNVDPILVRAAIAASRFGYGARPGELPFIAEDPDQWLLDQLEPRPETPPELAGLPNSRDLTVAMMESGNASDPAFQQSATRLAAREAERHALLAINGEEPFRERLVRFWSDHFGLTARHPRVLPLVHSFEREVIRPNLGASFYDMLLAAARHPALLFQFDQAGSVGPNSRAGRTGQGDMVLDFAQAIVERITMGTGESDPTRPSPGHNQSDIRELAKIMTGWSIAGPGEDGAGGFRYRANWHEHGRKKFLGRIFPFAEILEGEAAIDALTRRVETARNLSERMVRAFITDDPPRDLVNELYHTYGDSNGSLRAMTEKMLVMGAAWEPAQRKTKMPEEFVISAMRALGARPGDGGRAVRAMAALGQPPKSPPDSSGWPESGLYWLNDGRLGARLDVGAALGRVGAMNLEADGGGFDGIDIALDTLGPLLREGTYRRLAVAADRGEQLALLFASPEFQRR